ncbi:adenylyltransferase/cytidyltransferase family protein [Streptacidiphilus sp. N1-3]|uniref:Adenylyltransferase/cytidyltransferase family protein n=1 Tax=Streptacidiphilus alkalitolerans TaxID=3342712 RepID=A0ABV6X3Y3_9ACTN
MKKYSGNLDGDQADEPGGAEPGSSEHRNAAVVPTSGLFADASNFELRHVPDYARISQIVDALRVLGLKVVLTSGTFDILHEGHSMYLEAARRFGDFLIVGVDSDEKVRQRKGMWRPAVPESERLRMVTHQRGVGLVTLKQVNEPRWSLIDAVKPDVLVATADTYKPEEIAELEANHCGRVEVLDRMATVSTSARLRLLQLGLGERMSQRLSERLPDLLQDVIDEIGKTP